MNNKYIVFLILAVLVIVFLWNKNEHADTTTDNITAKNIKASGNIEGVNIDASGYIQSTISSLEGGTFYLKNPSKTGAGSTNNWAILNTKAPTYTPGLTFWRYNADGKHPGPAVIFNDNGNVDVVGVVSAKKFISTGDPNLPLSNEAIQNIGSVYNNNNLTATNITATNSITSSNKDGGSIQLVNTSKTGAGSTNNWAILNLKAPSAQGLNFWRYNADGAAPGPSVVFNDDGNVNMTDNLTVGRTINAKGDVRIDGNLYIGGILINGEKLKWVLNSTGLAA